MDQSCETVLLTQRSHVFQLILSHHTYLSIRRTASQTDFLRDVDSMPCFYILRTGCQWRYLPKDFPPKSTVWRYSTSGDTTGASKPSTTYFAARSARRRSPIAPDLGERRQPVGRHHLGGEQRGRDNAKNVDGRNAISSWTASAD